MKVLKHALLAVIVLCTVSGVVAAMQHEASAGKGKILFNDVKIGTSGKSCNSCHADGKGMDKAAGKKDLEAIINKCITAALQGKALDVKSMEMQSLVMYIKSIGSDKKPAATKTRHLGC